jgi:uncharacterized C2H2 Zn-finger protein
MERPSTEPPRKLDNGSLQCVKCHKTYKSIQSWRNHRTLRRCSVRSAYHRNMSRPSTKSIQPRENDSWQCINCSQTFKWEKGLKEHLKFSDSRCHARKTDDRNRQRKEQTEGSYKDLILGSVCLSRTEKGEYACPHCEKLFRRIDSIRRHVQNSCHIKVRFVMSADSRIEFNHRTDSGAFH